MGELSKRFYAIKNDREFRYLYKKGTCCTSYGFICYFRQTNRRRDRCGIVTGKKIGNAVRRNRSRRVIREAFRIFDHDIAGSTDKRFDFVFVARDKTAEMRSTQILGTMRLKLMPMLCGGNPGRNAKENAQPDKAGTQKTNDLPEIL